MISTQVWMDYISIPQVIGCSRSEVASVLADQKAAIQAIPAYVRYAQHFWICAPSGAQHVDTCQECNYDTWHSRGWCRMEEAALNLERLGDGRALLVTQPLGEEPAVSTFDKIDRAWNKTQRSNSPLTGAYSCCRMKHVVVSKDGATTKIGCDKVALKGVLHTLFDRKVAEIREACREEGSYKLDMEWNERMNHSNSSGVGAYRNLWFLVALKPMQLADTVDEIDYVERGWSKPFDELTREDYETFCREGNGHQGGLECDPERDLDTVAWNAANMGHLPMLRYCIEKLGADPNYSNHYHMSMLLMTGRFGHDACLRYLCSKLTKEQIDHTSGGLGLSAIGDAAKCGHAQCIRTLLSLGAAVDPRRKNGKTPLHEVYIRVEINLPPRAIDATSSPSCICSMAWRFYAIDA